MPQDQSALPELVLASALVAHQPGTVVSRTLVRKPAGTVTVFAFDETHPYRPHPESADRDGFPTESALEVSGDSTPQRSSRRGRSLQRRAANSRARFAMPRSMPAKTRR